MGRPLLVSLLTLVFLASGLTAQDEAAAGSADGGLSGELRYNAFVGVGDPAAPVFEKNGLAATLKLDRSFSPHTRVYLEARADLDATAYDPTSVLPGHQSFVLFPGEAYVQESFGPFDVDLGKRLVFWGRFDALTPFDVVNPHDYTLLSSDPLIETRVPVLLGRVAARWGAWDLDALVVPLFVPSVTPFRLQSLKTLIPGLPVTTVDPAQPGLGPDGFDYGFKAVTTWEGWDLYGVVFCGTNDNALTSLKVVPQMGPPQLVFTQSYYRFGVVGGGLEKTFGAFDLKVEAAYEANPDTGDADLFSPDPDVKYAVGLSWATTSELSVELQYGQKVLVGFDQSKHDAAVAALTAQNASVADHLGELLADKPSQTLVPSLRYTWNDRLTVQASAQIDLPDLDWFASPMVSWSWSDNLRLTAGASVFAGAKTTTWGRMDAADLAYFIATAYF